MNASNASRRVVATSMAVDHEILRSCVRSGVKFGKDQIWKICAELHNDDVAKDLAQRMVNGPNANNKINKPLAQRIVNFRLEADYVITDASSMSRLPQLLAKYLLPEDRAGSLLLTSVEEPALNERCLQLVGGPTLEDTTDALDSGNPGLAVENIIERQERGLPTPPEVCDAAKAAYQEMGRKLDFAIEGQSQLRQDLAAVRKEAAAQSALAVQRHQKTLVAFDAAHQNTLDIGGGEPRGAWSDRVGRRRASQRGGQPGLRRGCGARALGCGEHGHAGPDD